MKSKNLIPLLAALGFFTLANGQKNPGETKDGNINLLDAQAQVLGGMFGDSLGPIKATGYLDFLAKSDIPQSDKEKLAEYYMMYSKTLDAKGKDSLNAVMIKELEIAGKKKDTIK
ncbi:MAG: hypothetical protein OEQ81_05575 [Flavobacteriaceae bacterium]|nr:hypothetical protein [Flavobacteriaceae bacterium]